METLHLVGPMNPFSGLVKDFYEINEFIFAFDDWIKIRKSRLAIAGTKDNTSVFAVIGWLKTTDIIGVDQDEETLLDSFAVFFPQFLFPSLNLEDDEFIDQKAPDRQNYCACYLGKQIVNMEFAHRGVDNQGIQAQISRAHEQVYRKLFWDFPSIDIAKCPKFLQVKTD